MTLMRPCLGINGGRCPNLSRGPRCPLHEGEYQRARRAARPGHRAAHAQQRRAWQPTVATGQVRCARCNQLIVPDQAWDIDHLAGDVWHPSHAYCNRAAGGRLRKRT